MPSARLYTQWLIKTATITLQVSTATGVISHFVNLQVVVPEAFILGSGELHVDMGSTINLVCIIEKVRLITKSYSLLRHFRIIVAAPRAVTYLPLPSNDDGKSVLRESWKL